MAHVHEFKVKKVICETYQVHETVNNLEALWIQSLLLRAGIPAPMLELKTSGKTLNQEWREYLIATWGISITKNLATQAVDVFKYNKEKEKNIPVGKWNKPEVVRMKKDGKVYCELQINQWYII